MKGFWIAGMLIAAAAPADACLSPRHVMAIVHSGLPERLPPDLFVAELDFATADASALYEEGIPARVGRVIQGEDPGEFLRVKALQRTSCSHPFANGRAGLVVGRLRRDASGGLVLHPNQVARRNGFRMDRPRRPTP